MNYKLLLTIKLLSQPVELPKNFTVTLQNVISNQPSSGFLNEKNGPWLAALMIGLLTTGTNLYLSYLQRSSAEKLSRRQALSNNRLKLDQDWINDFRSALSDYLYTSTILNDKIKRGAFGKEFEETLDSLIKQQEVLNLILENNSDSKLLLEQLEKLKDIIVRKSVGFDSQKTSIILIAREIIQKKSSPDI